MKSHFLLFLAAVLSLFACQGQSQIESVSASAFEERRTTMPDAQLVDVRTPEEFAGDHIEGAKNINIYDEDFSAQIAKLDKSRPVLLYCKSGGRSRDAAKQFAQAGFSGYELRGGIVKYRAEGFGSNAPWTGMSEAEFDQLTAAGPKVLVDFYADWCAPCKKMAPFLEKLKNENNGVTLVKVDGDAHKSLLEAKKIGSIPTLQLYENGTLVWQHEGFISEQDLKSKL